MKPIISIIVPVYNVELYLSKCLDSLINQTFKDIEIILIDDGSLDNSLKIMKQYAKKDNRIVILTEENSGQGTARNLGIKKSKGDYIIFVDSDDYVSDKLCETLYNRALKDKSDLVFANFEEVDQNGNIIGSKKEELELSDDKRYIISQWGPCVKLIKSSIIKENDLYFPQELRAYEDIAITSSWMLYANKVSYINEVLYYYFIRQGSTMKQISYNKKLEDIFPSLEIFLKFFKDKNKYEEYQEEIEWVYIANLLHAASLRFIKFYKYESSINKIVNIIKKDFPTWRKNKYLKKTNLKYRIVCYLIFYKKISLLKLLLKEV